MKSRVPFVEPFLSEIVSLSETTGVTVIIDDDNMEFETDLFHIYLPNYKKEARLDRQEIDEEVTYSLSNCAIVIIIGDGHFNITSPYIDVGYRP